MSSEEEDYEYDYSEEDDDGGVDDVSMDDSSLCDAQPTSAKSSLPNKKRAYGSMDTKRISGASEPRLSGGELV